jgi:hypothetical protein
VDGQLVTVDVLLDDRVGEQLLGQNLRLGIGDQPPVDGLIA